MSLSNLQNTWNAKVLSKSDTEAQVEFSGKWVNYLGPDGNWAPINCNLVPTAEGWSVTEAPFNFNAPKFADDEAFFESDVRWDIWGQQEITDDPFGMYIKADLAEHIEGKLFDINGDGHLDAVIYKNAFPAWNADLIYYVKHGRAPRLEKLVQFNSDPGVAAPELEIPFSIRYTGELTIKEKIKELKASDIARIKKHTDKRDVENRKHTKQSHCKAQISQVCAFEAGRKVWSGKKTRMNKSVMHRPNGGSTMRGIGMKDFKIWDSDIKVQTIEVEYEQITPTEYKLTKLVPNDFFTDAVFPVRTDVVGTFYPDPDTETTSVDGRFAKDLQSSWEDVDSGSASVVADSETESGITKSSQDGSVQFYSNRGMFLFDTSSIGVGTDTITITVGTLSLYVTALNNDESTSVIITSSNPASNTVLAYADWTLFGAVSFASIALASLSTSAYNDFTLDANGRNNIDIDGISKFGTFDSKDFNDSAPGVWKSNSVTTYMAERTATTEDPKLVVTYTVTLGTPTSPTATATDTTTNIDLTWVDNSSSEDNYSVEVSDTGSGGWTVLATLAAGVQTYQHAVGTNSTIKYYRIRATSATHTDSAYTSTVNATTAPANPSAPAVTNANGSQVLTVTWTDNSSDETSFSVERSDDGTTGWAEIGTTAAGATSYADNVAAYGTRKYYRVRARRSGDGIDSDYTSVANNITAPEAPSGLALSTSQGASQFRVSWTDNSSTETTFSIERRKAGDDAFAEITTDTTTPYDDTGLAEETLYFYRIRAYNATDTVYSAYTTVVSARTLSPVPTNLRALPNEETSVMLLWDDSSFRSTGIKVERSLDDAAWATVATTAKGILQYEDTGRTNGTTYYYRVSTVGPDGTSAATSSVSVVANMATTAGMEFAINKKLNSFPTQ